MCFVNLTLYQTMCFWNHSIFKYCLNDRNLSYLLLKPKDFCYAKYSNDDIGSLKDLLHHLDI